MTMPLCDTSMQKIKYKKKKKKKERKRKENPREN
jgi:hypothetical protein